MSSPSVSGPASPALSRFRALLRFAGRRVTEVNIAEVASSMALTTILAMVPMLALSLAIFAAFPSFAGARDSLEQLIAGSFLPPQYSETLIGYMRDFAGHAAGLTTFGLAGLAVTALLLIDKLFVTVNRLFKVRSPRPWPQRVLLYWALITLGPLAVATSLTLAGQATAMALSGVDSATLSVIYGVGQFALKCLGFAVLYKLIPNRSVPWAHAFFGGLLAAAVGLLLKIGFEYYVTAGTLRNIYGAFVALPVLLLWIYLAWYLFFAGAAVTATIPQLTAGRHADSFLAGNDFFTALVFLRAFDQRRREDAAPVLTLRQLCQAGDASPEYAERVLDGLAGCGYVAPVKGSRGDSWALTVDPQKATLEPVFSHLCADFGNSLLSDVDPPRGSVGALRGLRRLAREDTLLRRPLAEVL